MVTGIDTVAVCSVRRTRRCICGSPTRPGWPTSSSFGANPTPSPSPAASGCSQSFVVLQRGHLAGDNPEMGLAVTRIGVTLAVLVSLLFLAAGPAEAQSDDPVAPGQIQADATFEHIGFVWWIDGDADLDATLTLEYRTPGASAWRRGAMAVHACPSIRVQDGPLGLNYLAASAMLPRGRNDVRSTRLTLTDPDGGSTTRMVTATTRTPPVPDPAGRRLFRGSGRWRRERHQLGPVPAASKLLPMSPSRATPSTLRRARTARSS